MPTNKKKTKKERETKDKYNCLYKHVDLLDEDKPIAGQKFCCLSFICPEDIIDQKNMFLMREFLKGRDLSKAIDKFQPFLHYISHKYNFDFDTMIDEFKNFIKEERDDINDGTIMDDYKNFLDLREDDLGKQFDEMNRFQTSTRGLKVRGVFETQQEAEMKCKSLRETDPNHDILVGPVGIWLPVNPTAYKLNRVEYLNDELNTLMHEKFKNKQHADTEFEKRVKEAKEEAIKENMEKAELYGTKLSQTIDEDGNLINLRNTSDLTNMKIMSADVKKELDEDKNILLPKQETDKGLSRLK